MANEHDFDFKNFAVNVIKVVDEIRSFEKDNITFPSESRINALYRAIGLPAVIIKDSKMQSANNGNTFDVKELQYEIFQSDFDQRQFGFRTAITEEEISNFLNFNDSNLSDGIQTTQNGQEQLPIRIRGSLFPMVVDGEIEIFPQEKRVANAFEADSDLEIGANIYRRPLIESIILIRLKSQGLQDTNLQQKVSQDYGIDSVQQLQKIASMIISTTDSAFITIARLLDETIININKAKINTSIDFVPIISNIAQQSIERSDKSKKIGQYDLQKALQEDHLRIKQAVLTVLEYDDTFQKETKASRNVKGAILASNLLSLLNSGDNDNVDSKIQKDIDDTDRALKKYEADIKEGIMLLDLFFGTFSGLSGVDILVVFKALFAIPMNNLIGLLNDKAIQNLKDIKGESAVKNKSAVADAIDALQNKVQDIYKTLDDIIKNDTVIETEEIIEV